MRLVQRIFLFGLLCSCGGVPLFAQERVTGKNPPDYAAVLKAVVDLRTLDLLGDVDSANWVLSVIVRPSFDEPELFIGLASYSSGSVRLVVQKPHPLSVYRQIQEHAGVNFADTKNISKIKLSPKIVDSNNCQELSRVVAKWQILSFAIVPKNELRLDATGYDLELRSRYGNRLIANFEGGKLTEDMSPIIRLIAETSKACA